MNGNENREGLESRLGKTVAEQNLEFLEGIDIDEFVTYGKGGLGNLKFTYNLRDGRIIAFDQKCLSRADLEDGLSIGFFDKRFGSENFEKYILFKSEKGATRYAKGNLSQTIRLYNSRLR